jgi:hypothetical protein
MKTQHELKMASAEIVMKFLEEGFDIDEVESVLAYTLAVTGRSEGRSLHETISQFTTAAKDVFSVMGEKK